MGFIHDTETEILGVETRSESACLSAEGTERLLFLPKIRRSAVRAEIVSAVMRDAGEAFAKGDDKRANELKKLAEYIDGLKLRPDYEPQSFEADYKWIAALVKFCNENNTMRGHLAAASTTAPTTTETPQSNGETA